MGSRFFRAAALVATLLLSRPGLAAGGVQKGPYLQHVTSTSIELRVELATPALATVEVRSDGRLVQTVSDPARAFHSLHVTGLTPGTRYDYTVHLGANGVRSGAFVTAPSDSSHDPVTFIAYGDNRSDGPAHERVTRAMQRETFDFAIHTGDFVIGGGDSDAWQSFFDIEQPLLAGHCLFACVGNHELHEDSEAAHFERYFGPSTAPSLAAASPARLYGTFRWGRARFFLLNAFQAWSPGAERQWLEQELVSADQEPDLAWRIVVIHHGPYSAGPHGNNKVLLAAHVDDLLREHHVDLVVGGHDHIYERGDASGLKYIVTGGGGAPLYADSAPIPSTRKVEAAYHYVLTTLTDDRLEVLAKRADGSVLDQCSAGHTGSWLCDPPKPATSAPAASAAPASADLPADHAHCGCLVPRAYRAAPEARLGGLVLVALFLQRRMRRPPRR